MGVLRRYGMSYTYLSVNRGWGSYMLHPDSKSLPSQTFNDTVALGVGRKPGPSSYPSMRF